MHKITFHNNSALLYVVDFMKYYFLFSCTGCNNSTNTLLCFCCSTPWKKWPKFVFVSCHDYFGLIDI